jgi:steroid 5-alpha reductase family enzyme
MIRTILLLIFTLIILPIFAFYFDQPLSELQKSTLNVLLYIMLATSLIAFLLGEVTGNNSQVDKIWSIMPIIYVWYVAYASSWNQRLVLMAIPVSVWGIRLTYNFSRRGAYKLKFWEGEEDYRWKILRQNPALKGRWKWMLFNLFFICLYQMSLILLFSLPSLVAMQGVEKPLGLFDYLLATLMLGFIIIETIADQQQWNFQNEKHRLIKAGKLTAPYRAGFIQSGLWSIVRHPNYASEQAIWIVFYLFSVSATGRWLNWSIAGCLLLMILFKGSSDFSENISAGKYPEYKNYQKKVPRFIPFLKF